MDDTSSLQTQVRVKEDKYVEVDSEELKQLIKSLPREKGWRSRHLYLYQDFWVPSSAFTSVITFQQHFQTQNTDIIITGLPKSGNTWLKALIYSIVNRKKFSIDKSPLNTTKSHDLVLSLEDNLYVDNKNPDLSAIEPPRMFSTHLPFPSLPDSIKATQCRVVYVCRNPFDNFISLWHFVRPATRSEDSKPLSLEEAFDLFCRGVSGYGPFWDHMLGFWNESLKNPRKFLFLTFEDMKLDIKSQMKKLAEFLGLPFDEDEEKQGVIDEISIFCSFKNMRELQPNKEGKIARYFDAQSFFRKGEVGDWVNYLTPSMADRLNKVMEAKLGDSGLEIRSCVS